MRARAPESTQAPVVRQREGANFSQVVKLTVLAEASFHQNALAYAEVRNRYINLDNPPASAVFLAPRLIHEGALVDIAAIAHLPA